MYVVKLEMCKDLSQFVILTVHINYIVIIYLIQKYCLHISIFITPSIGDSSFYYDRLLSDQSP